MPSVIKKEKYIKVYYTHVTYISFLTNVIMMDRRPIIAFQFFFQCKPLYNFSGKKNFLYKKLVFLKLEKKPKTNLRIVDFSILSLSLIQWAPVNVITVNVIILLM